MSVSRSLVGNRLSRAEAGVFQSPKAVRLPAPAARLWGRRLVVLTIGVWLLSLALGFETGLLLLTLVGFTAVLVGLWKPSLGVLGVAILCTLDAVSRVYLFSGGILRWNTFNYWLVAVMLLHVGWLIRLKGLQVRLLQALILLLAAELAVSADRIGGAQHVLNLVTLFGLLVYFMRARKDREIWYWSALVSAVVSALGSLVFYLQEESLPEINSNAWSFFPLTSLFATCVYFGSSVRKRREYGLVILAFVNAGWVYLSGSRGSLVIGMICLLFLFIRIGPRKRPVFALASVVLLFVVSAGQFEDQESRAQYRVSVLFDPERSIANKTSGRSELAYGGWQIFLANPLGVGTGGFARTWSHLRRQHGIRAFIGDEKQAHSGWVKVLAENGVVGFLLLAGFVASFSAEGWRHRRAGTLFLGILATLVLGVAFVADEFQAKGLWYLAGATMLFLSAAPSGAARTPEAQRRARTVIAVPSTRAGPRLRGYGGT